MMSFDDTWAAATASIGVSPATTGTSCIGPQVVGVIAPENVPVAVASAPPTKSASSAVARMPTTRNPGRGFTCAPPRGLSLRTWRAQKLRRDYTHSEAKSNLSLFATDAARLTDQSVEID